MKKTLEPLKKVIVPMMGGALLMLVVSEIFPVCSLRFWRVAFASECAIGYVGIGGSPATNSLLSESIGAAPTAVLSYRALYAVGNAQGKAYAVMGLRHVDHEVYLRLRDDLALRPGSVRVHSGCMVTDVSCEETALWIESVNYGDDESRAKAIAEFKAHIEQIKLKKATR